MSQDIKYCYLCKTELKPENWQPCRQKINSKICSACSNAKASEWKKNNPEKVKKQKRDWSKRNPEKIKNWHSKVTDQSKRKTSLKKNYGLTWDGYLLIYEKFNGCCAICNKELSLLKEDNKETAHIDHCHTTNKVRGILCRSCNRGLGYFADLSERLDKASKYLLENS